ncbi:bifunctional isocitrate dehydrogenase kinase/phosphatase [Anaeromyxobacter sp. Fw109-5]|uniref:Isocitrate dehydrogenase kinase/phosphatase n=1 Tax=Anaeromyxobacter sp. (strain Fw109-5) TaxID=404589 RepID=ACEK_ANADF|nr:bifunctional isocitrate dehydrogenase kinase/phosphatase [Anaeromyxobacter sp. Fw109-5]A7HB82.1 RecName: Full=Isocitrate dehydrogenase kinase/phosphatase; Short=IDH kinase/phosphatase; Short=IDHK/P [Anaeromyxobacter sp. Fw109-5]ABS25978.1 (Isocitrate dehydrogenase (NADP(+))) kinase [Anaeromyxobacter sp. Fw109-5]
MAEPNDVAAAGAAAIAASFEAYQEERARITRRARERFEKRDWAAGQADARERLDLRDRLVNACVGTVRAELGGAAHDHGLWRAMKELYEARVESRPDREIGQSFFNSVTRRVFVTVGVDPAIEFLAADGPAVREGPVPVYARYRREVSTEALLRTVLRACAFAAPYEDLERDARIAAIELDSHLRELDDGQPIEALELVKAVFYRGKGAYLVGRLRRGRYTTPLVLALVHGERGVVLDAILFTQEDVSIVFSFTRSYFHVEVERPRELVAFLSTLLPLKRVSELYIALGFNKHGKTELYREIARHIAETGEAFVPARGDKGLVMSVFTLPGLDVVFKVIKDEFKPPKQTTRREVMDKYRHVFRHDRAGRLVDAQEFEHLAFPADRFSPEVLRELSEECRGSIEIGRAEISVKHLYAERRVTPLNLFIREADEWTARQAVLDFGRALKDLAATNTFPGDLLLKNFGVTRHGRVIFYDYDELTRVTDCVFRDLPTPSGDDEETSGEPWFYVGQDDVFPEELLPFLGLAGRLREVFLQAHGDLLTARYWRAIQERIREGEIVDIYPYREEQRLVHGYE